MSYVSLFYHIIFSCANSCAIVKYWFVSYKQLLFSLAVLRAAWVCASWHHGGGGPRYAPRSSRSRTRAYDRSCSLRWWSPSSSLRTSSGGRRACRCASLPGAAADVHAASWSIWRTNAAGLRPASCVSGTNVSGSDGGDPTARLSSSPRPLGPSRPSRSSRPSRTLLVNYKPSTINNPQEKSRCK